VPPCSRWASPHASTARSNPLACARTYAPILCTLGAKVHVPDRSLNTQIQFTHICTHLHSLVLARVLGSAGHVGGASRACPLPLVSTLASSAPSTLPGQSCRSKGGGGGSVQQGSLFLCLHKAQAFHKASTSAGRAQKVRGVRPRAVVEWCTWSGGLLAR